MPKIVDYFLYMEVYIDNNISLIHQGLERDILYYIYLADNGLTVIKSRFIYVHKVNSASSNHIILYVFEGGWTMRGQWEKKLLKQHEEYRYELDKNLM